MTFVDNLEAIEVKLAESQREAAALERDKQELVSETRLANHRAAQAERAVEEITVEVQSATRRANEAVERAAHSERLQEQVYSERDRANKAEAGLALAQSRLEVSEKERKKAQKELRETAEILRAREDTYEKSERLLKAFEQRAEADKVLGS